MKVRILGYGKEGKSAEQYFSKHHHQVQIFDNFTPDEIRNKDFSSFDLVLRSPSLRPSSGWSSVTKYFFEHCPCPIIGVTGTKGKGTTCSMVDAILKALGYQTWLVGNIGTPAIDILDQLLDPQDQKDQASQNHVVIYELSSFQLWDLDRSPHIAAVLRIEPDHLNIHGSFTDYTEAKSNIVRWQKPDDSCIYYAPNPDSTKIALLSPGHHIPYPVESPNRCLESALNALQIPGDHNRENAQAALLTVAAFLNLPLGELLEKYRQPITTALANFRGLPHRIEFLRLLRNVLYYDDTFSTTPPALKVALAAFPQYPLIPIIGGRDKTDNADLPEIAALILETPNLQKAILIGESGHALAKILPPDKFIVSESLKDAVLTAQNLGEQLSTEAVVIMSPTAASFDMFKNEFDRGEQYQTIVHNLK